MGFLKVGPIDGRQPSFIPATRATSPIAGPTERNIEAGVLLDHPELARMLAGKFRWLRESGHLRRMG